MSKITVNASNVSGVQLLEVRYRIFGSTGAYNIIQLTPVQLPYDILNVNNGRYEVQMRKSCSGKWSDWSSVSTDACPAPIGFQVSRDGSNFVVIYSLNSGQTKSKVEITDPNGGKAIVSHTGLTTDTFTIPINPFLNGNYSLRMKAICDDSVNPVFESDWTLPVSVSISSGCNPPQITGVSTQSFDTNTMTKRVSFTSATSNVRVRVVDNSTNGEVQNGVVSSSSGYVDIVLLKGKTFTIQVFNQCTGGQEAGATTQANTAYTALSAKMGAATNSVCQNNSQNVYVAAQYTDVVSGATVYSDQNLSNPVTGPYITNSQGKIFNISSYGLVGSDTGVTCGA